MDISPEVIQLGTQLATVAGKKSVEVIFDKIRTVKEKGNKDEIIGHLEEIINDLIADKNQLIQISQAFEENLVAQRMTDTEIEYITESVIPLIETFIRYSDSGEADKIQASIDLIKPLLSKEMFNIMQILGFNFRKAIGEPLTELLSAWISSKIPSNLEIDKRIRALSEEKEIEYIKLARDEEAYNRLLKLYGR